MYQAVPLRSSKTRRYQDIVCHRADVILPVPARMKPVIMMKVELLNVERRNVEGWAWGILMTVCSLWCVLETRYNDEH